MQEDIREAPIVNSPLHCCLVKYGMVGIVNLIEIQGDQTHDTEHGKASDLVSFLHRARYFLAEEPNAPAPLNQPLLHPTYLSCSDYTSGQD